MPTAISVFLDILVIYSCMEICLKLADIKQNYEMAKI